MTPLVFLAGGTYSLVRAPSFPEPVRNLMHFCAIAVVALLFVHESQPLFYCNVRYLTYIWPFLFARSWAAYSGLGTGTLSG